MSNGPVCLFNNKVRKPFRDYFISGKRKINGSQVRKNFALREDAIAEKNRLEIRRLNAADEVKIVTTRLTLDQTREAETAFRLLEHGGGGLTVAVQYYLDNFRAPMTEMLLAEALEAYFVAKESEVQTKQLSNVQAKSIRKHLSVFSKEHPKFKIGQITTVVVKDFLSRHDWAAKTWNNQRSYISAFFTFCQDQNWVAENPASKVKFFTVKGAKGTAATISADEAADLMKFVADFSGGPRTQKPGIMVNHVALCLFAGIRPDTSDGEISKLPAEHIRKDLGRIVVEPWVSKTDELRHVDIQPNLHSWLDRYPLVEFPIMPKNAAKLMRTIREEMKLSQDVLRHTYISMHVAKFRSIGDAALQAGNSEAVIRKSYLNVKTREEAERFWNIFPPT